MAGHSAGAISSSWTATGAIAWQYKSERPMYGGALATASNLVFTGEMTGDFLAFGVGDQFLADTGVEKVSRHETRTISIWGLTAAACHLDPVQQSRSHDATLNPLIRRCFDSGHTNK